MRRNSALLILLVFVGLLVLTACGSDQETHASADLASVDQLPEWAQNAPPRVREAYQYAVANPEELAHYPCYCGCGGMGHTSNLSCFVSEFAPDGTVLAFDSHANGCGICVDIAQDVMRLKGEGQSSVQVRAYIDAQYSPFGPPTDTEYPAE